MMIIIPQIVMDAQQLAQLNQDGVVQDHHYQHAQQFMAMELKPEQRHVTIITQQMVMDVHLHAQLKLVGLAQLLVALLVVTDY